MEQKPFWTSTGLRAGHPLFEETKKKKEINEDEDDDPNFGSDEVCLLQLEEKSGSLGEERT